MQPFRLLRLELLKRLEANLEMLIDSLPVELAGHAGQLDLSVQRLVRATEQRAVGHAEAKAIGGDGCRLHVKRDGARLRQAANVHHMVAELPIAVVDAG